MWVARITAVAFEMFIPGLVGQWLDNRFGTSFLALAGFAFGLIGGMWHLLLMTGAYRNQQDNRSSDDKED